MLLSLMCSKCFQFILGPLNAPYAFDINVIDTTLILSWGAPFSLDVTDSPEIFYYILCANFTLYGCRIIPSDSDCTFPSRCIYSVDFAKSQIPEINKLETYAIVLSLRAVNGAGNGTATIITYTSSCAGKTHGVELQCMCMFFYLFQP